MNSGNPSCKPFCRLRRVYQSLNFALPYIGLDFLDIKLSESSCPLRNGETQLGGRLFSLMGPLPGLRPLQRKFDHPSWFL
ncbi:hypothetical protein AYI68_g1518 [Smittium mucronatum]|uniref:Uncharacterized protein n=1 Tax=Smittium mucronatum TaxID=133383 RepID=A0A1R0H515_9FUNG|nr:hypothetical protein AYI68_g1518 [Smittium mucronatum]